MHNVNGDGNHSGHEGQMDSFAGKKLRLWLEARANLLSPAIKVLLGHLHEFARQIESEGFGSVTKKLIGHQGEKANLTQVVEAVAKALCQDIRGNELAIARKSLQEAFYQCTGVDPNLSLSEFGKRLQTFVRLRGSKGLIRLFLRQHLSNVIWTDLHESMEAVHDVMKKRAEAVDRVCQTATEASLRPLARWPELTTGSMDALARTLKLEMTKSITVVILKKAARRKL